eukprot:5850720-Ditylum_brightwellii.AAC.1
MSKRPSDMPQIPYPHPSSRVESDTDTGVDAGTGPPGEGGSNNGAFSIPPEEVGTSVSVHDADPSSVIPLSNAAESVVEPVTNADGSDMKVSGSAKSDEEEKPNTTSETTGEFQEKIEHKDSSPHKLSSHTSKEDNDSDSGSEDNTNEQEDISPMEQTQINNNSNQA